MANPLVDALLSKLIEKILSDPAILDRLGKTLLEKLLSGGHIGGGTSGNNTPSNGGVGSGSTTDSGSDATSAGAEEVVLESWFEEFWHDWFKGSLPGGPDSDWAPSGSPKHTAILSGREKLPPGASIFVFTGVRDPKGGPAFVPGPGKPKPFEIEHVFEFAGKEFVIPSNAEEGTQRWPELGHVQYGGRGWKASEGWAFVLQLKDPGGSGPGKLTYKARVPGGRLSEGVGVLVARAAA